MRSAIGMFSLRATIWLRYVYCMLEHETQPLSCTKAGEAGDVSLGRSHGSRQCRPAVPGEPGVTRRRRAGKACLMTVSLYVRPTARIGPQPKDGGRLPVLSVGGRSDLEFAAAEIIEREEGAIRRVVRPCERLEALPGGLPDLIDRIRQPRLPIAGL